MSLAFSAPAILHRIADPAGEARIKLEATAGARSFREFMRMAWPHMDPAHLLWNWHNELVCDEMERAARREVLEMVISVPPRTSKSVTILVAFPAWVWTWAPEARFITASYEMQLATRDAVTCRSLVKSDWYQRRWGPTSPYRPKRDDVMVPGVQIDPVQDNKTFYATTAKGYRFLATPGSSVTGWGADFILADDINPPNKVESEAERINAAMWWFETIPTRLNDAAHGVKIVIQQRVHAEDLAGQAIKKGYYPVILPMEFDPKHPMRHPRDPRTTPGELLHPDRMPAPAVARLKKALGPYACTPAESPVLMRDLSLRPISQVQPGDEVVGFAPRPQAEGAAYARLMLQPARVVRVHRYPAAEVVRLRFESGATARCTPDHLWYKKARNDGRWYSPAEVGSRLARICPPDGVFGSKFVSARERVVAIEPNGQEDVFALETTTGNYVVWGLASSNSAAQLQQLPGPREGGLFKLAKFRIIPTLPAGTPSRVRAWDLAATAPEPGKDPDWTVGVKLLRYPDETVVIEHVERFRDEPDATRSAIRAIASQDGAGCPIFLPQEPGAAGKALGQDMVRALAGYAVRLQPQTGDKWTRAQPFAAQVAVGNVCLLAAEWNKAFLEELTGFPNAAHDDQVDAVSSGYIGFFGAGTGVQEYMQMLAQQLAEADREDAEDIRAIRDAANPGLPPPPLDAWG